MSEWFVAHVAELPWVAAAGQGAACVFEDDERRLRQVETTVPLP